MLEKRKWSNALREACDRLARIEYMVEKGKNQKTYIPNANETIEINIQAMIIYTDIVKRNNLEEV